MAQLIISVSGLRGIVGESLTPLVAAQYTAAFAAGLPLRGSVVLTRDGRATGSLFAQTIAATLQASGLNVLYGDAAATPTTGVLVREHAACAGIQISASHNPPPYNGIKLFGADGRVIPASAGERVIEHYHARHVRWVTHDQIGSFQNLTDTTSAHLAKVLATVDVAAIRRRRFRVVLDSNHGAGAVLGERLLAELGCDVTLLGPKPDGLFAHPPEPTADNLRSTAERAVKLAADAVFCQDPDADRLALIDETGRYIGEEFTVAIVLDHRLATGGSPGVVVTNCSTSRMSADICQTHGSRLLLSAVGEANVTDRMLQEQAIYGGEGNGGPIDPRVGYVRDSFVGMAQVLDCMAKHHLPLSQLAARLPQYAIHKTTITIERERIAGLFTRLREHFSDAAASTLDGLRLDWPDSWLLVRASNTEPIIRAVAEAKSADRARELCVTTAQLAAQ
jgi:phosphomannomutase